MSPLKQPPVKEAPLFTPLYSELTILKAPRTATFGVDATAGQVVNVASNALSLDNLLSPVSISICEIGDDDDAFSRSNICMSSSWCSSSPRAGGGGEPLFLSPSPFARSVVSGEEETPPPLEGAEDPFSSDWLMDENRVSCWSWEGEEEYWKGYEVDEFIRRNWIEFRFNFPSKVVLV